MRGEHLEELEITSGGVSGDRWFALRETKSRRLADARKTPRLLHYQAGVSSAKDNHALVTMPDGKSLRTDSADLATLISADLKMPVSMERRVDQQELGFIDDAPIHLATQQTLDTLKSLNEKAVFDTRRFRPNILMTALQKAGNAPYPEDLWVGRVLALGRHVRLQITKACARCAMTTLEQDELPTDHSVLKTVVDENTGNLGVYATVITEGTIRVGDKGWLE